ncbi:MAG TPA: tyrosine-type recombinase/integrase [Candidatus Acidoferrales bacterium]|nr:tyrosine-type recombinase/integrase [Candidatus Acidoferrales bacterium]
MNATKTAAMDPLVEGYLSYLDKVGRKTPRTIIDVRCTLRRAITGLEAVRPGVALWHLQLEDFLHWLEAERQRGSTESSLAKYLSHVRGLLDYAWRSGRTERNVLDGFGLQHTQRRTVPNFLNLEEAERLVQATTAPGPTARRDRLIILLLYGCGLRTSELCALDVAYVNRERQELLILKAKGDRPRAIPIPEALYTELLAYLLEHGKRGPLFRTSIRKQRLRAKDVCEIVTAAAARAGLRAGVTPRTLRHSFATHLMDRGVDLAVIASLMGHRSPQETGVYLHVLPERMQAAVRTLPIGNG